MNKTRAENLSDGVFAIVMTLLVFDIRLPAINPGMMVTNAQVWAVLGSTWPYMVSYSLSFLVLAVFWTNHNFLFHVFMKELDRSLNLMNMIYLLFLVLIPFSALLVGTYPYNQPAALFYGLNILAVIVMAATMVRYIAKHQDVQNVTSRVFKQARIRTTLTEVSYVLGIIFTFFYIPASIFFYLFPLLFNIIPGSLNLVEKIFKFELT
jgi:uncharacterized membrane protein